MQVKTCEIQEEKIVEAVRFAVSRRFSLDELSRLLVLEGGVDLDTLARIIRENRGDETVENNASTQSNVTGMAASNVSPIRNWFGMKQAG
ncbi:MAG: hypothetical protein ABJH63_04200 [Rhizobiaceae bacterium]